MEGGKTMSNEDMFILATLSTSHLEQLLMVFLAGIVVAALWAYGYFWHRRRQEKFLPESKFQEKTVN